MQRLDQLAPVQEKLLLLDEAVYLHLQTTEGGYDYTIYDKDTLRQMDGGQLDAPELLLSTAALKICEMHDLGGQSIKYAPLAMIETLQEAQLLHAFLLQRKEVFLMSTTNISQYANGWLDNIL